MKPRVLILQDFAPALLLLEQAFALAGFDVDGVDLWEEGAPLLEANVYDAMIIDDNLPDISGFAIMRILRARDYEGFVAYIGSSAYGEQEDQARALGAHEVFAYPLDGAAIAAAALAFMKTTPALPAH